MTNILSDKVLYASAYAESLTKRYPFRCDTLKETTDFLRAQHVYVSNGYLPTELPKAFKDDGKDHFYIFVEFSLESNFTVHEIRLMPVHKRYLPRVKAFLKDFETDNADT